MRGSMLIPTCQSCSLVTSVILLIGGLLARRKANSLQRRMGFCFWKHLQEQLRMLRRWDVTQLIYMSRLLYTFKWLDNRELWCEFWNVVINDLFLLLIKWISYNHISQAFIKTAAKILQNIQEGALDALNDVSHFYSCQIEWTSHFGIIQWFQCGLWLPHWYIFQIIIFNKLIITFHLFWYGLLMYLTRGHFVLIIFSNLELRLGTDAAKDHQVQEMELCHKEVDVAVKCIQM